MTDTIQQHSRELDDLRTKVAQLEYALSSRIIIEQAKGVLAERLAITVDAAFDILRYAARSHREKLHEIAAKVVHGRETPAPVIVALARTQQLRAASMRDIAEAHRERVEELRTKLNQQSRRILSNRRET